MNACLSQTRQLVRSLIQAGFTGRIMLGLTEVSCALGINTILRNIEWEAQDILIQGIALLYFLSIYEVTDRPTTCSSIDDLPGYHQHHAIYLRRSAPSHHRDFRNILPSDAHRHHRLIQEVHQRNQSQISGGPVWNWHRRPQGEDPRPHRLSRVAPGYILALERDGQNMSRGGRSEFG